MVLLRTEPAGALGALPLPFVAVVATIWIIGFQNAVNFLDNMDGIVAGVVALGLLGLAPALDGGAMALALGVAAATVGFLPWNAASPARLYLGDAGALPLGHALGFLAFVSAWSAPSLTGVASALIVVLIPLVDITFVTVTRLRAGRSPAIGGRDHTTHRIFALLGTVPRTRSVFWGLALLLCALSGLGRGLGGAAPLVLLGALVLGALAAGRWLATCPTPDAAPPGD